MKLNQKIKVLISVSLKIIVSFSLLVFLLHRIELTQIIQVFSKVRVEYYCFAFSLLILGQIITSYRWKILLQTQGIYPQLRELFLFYFIGKFFNLFLPTIVGGDAVRGYYLYKYSNRGFKSVSSIIIERFTGVFVLINVSLVAVALGSFIFKMNIPHIKVILGTIAFIYFLLISLLLLVQANIRFAHARWHKYPITSRLVSIVTKGTNALRDFITYRSALLKVFLLSVLFQCLNIVSVYVLSLSINLNIPLQYFFLFVPIIFVTAMLPISISGIGVRESAFVLFFSSVGVRNVEALSISILFFSLFILCGLIGGGIYIFKK